MADIFATAMQQAQAGMNPQAQQTYDFAMQQAQQNAAGSAPGQNPYLQQLGNAMSSQMTDQFNRQMTGMNSGVMAAGGYGGSRQGVLQANAMNDLNNQIGGALTNLYNQGYQADQQYDLGLKNIGLGYGNLAQGVNNSAMQNALGWGGVAGGIQNANTAANAQITSAQTAANASMYNAQLANELGYANLDRNINNDNLGWQMQGANFGLGLYDRMNANNQGIAGVGSTIQNQPLNYWGQFSNAANSLGNGFSNGAVPQTGNPIMGALGGAQMGQQLWGGGNNNLWSGSWMGGGSNPNVAGDAYMPAYQPMGSP